MSSSETSGKTLFSHKKINRLVGKAMHTYNMISDGDRILVAVSGGIDSLALAWLLLHWREKAPINYDLLAVHIDMGFDQEASSAVRKQLQLINIPFIIESTTYGLEAYENKENKSGCFTCSRKRRNHLFQMASKKDFNKIALGHHKDDIIETFFINMLYSGNISTMLPRQDLFHGKLALIRPLAYLDKEKVKYIAAKAGLSAVKNPCPMAENSKREEVRNLLTSLYKNSPNYRENIFASLGNVRSEYLLKQHP